jgi:hypothetical protein
MSNTLPEHRDTVLTDNSVAYLKSRGMYDTATKWWKAVEQARDRINQTLFFGAPTDIEDVKYVVDWYNDNADPNDGAGNEGNSFVQLQKYFFTGFESMYEGKTRARVYLEAGGTISDDLAPLFLDARFHASVAERNAYIAKAMHNHAHNPESTKPPSIELIKAFLSSPGTIGTQLWATDQNTLGGPMAISPWPANTTTTMAARAAIEGWIGKLLKGEAEPGSTLDPELLKAYIDSDPDASAAWIADTLQTSFAATGPVPATALTLLETYRGLNPSGPGGPVRDPATLDKGFDPAPPPHPIAGWTTLALDLTEKLAREGLPPQPAILARLDEVHPWAGAYARYSTLRQQIERGQNLDTTLLKDLAKVRPSAAEALCLLQFESSYQSSLALINSDGAIETSRYSSSNTPRLRNFLTDLGTPPPKIGDTVRLFNGASEMVAVQLTVTHLAQGYVDLVPTSSLPDGRYDFNTTIQRGAGEPQSSPGIPLQILLDASPPSANSAEYSNVTRQTVINFGPSFLGLDSIAPDPSAFEIDLGGSGNAPAIVSVVVDAIGNRVVLNHAGFYPNNVFNMTVRYSNPDNSNALRDLAGNAIQDFFVNGVQGSLETVVATTLSPAPLNNIKPRAMDHGAMDMLKVLRPDLAASWLARFTAANLIGPPPPPPPAPPAPPPKAFSEMTPEEQDQLALQVLVKESYSERYRLIEKMVRDQMEKIQLQNTYVTRLAELRRVLSSLQVDTNAGNDQQKMNEILPDSAEAGWVSKIQAAEALLPGLEIFSQTAGETDPAKKGRFSLTQVTKRGLADAIDALGKKIEAASGDQQLFMTDLQSLMGKASDASSTMSNILKRLHDNNEAIIRNL